MADRRTTLTELATALGCLGAPSLAWAVLQRDPILAVDASTWSELDEALHDPTLDGIGEVAFANGQRFAAHPDGLDGRAPRLIEWTGGRGSPGDQVIPADLRIDHVYLVSCKYLSRIVLNTSPGRLVEHLLDPMAGRDGSDWFARVAPGEYADLCTAVAAHYELPVVADPARLDRAERLALRDALRADGRQWPADIGPRYDELVTTVSEATAAALEPRLRRRRDGELFLWRMLRLAGAPYFVLGVSPERAALRLRVMTPWDWRQAFELRTFDVWPDTAGQPQIRWRAVVTERSTGRERCAEGRVEIRWSHGRFGAPPEAKVHLETPHHDVPGYVPLA